MTTIMTTIESRNASSNRTLSATSKREGLAFVAELRGLSLPQSGEGGEDLGE